MASLHLQVERETAAQLELRVEQETAARLEPIESELAASRAEIVELRRQLALGSGRDLGPLSIHD